jgi:hypothetical protein
VTNLSLKNKQFEERSILRLSQLFCQSKMLILLIEPVKKISNRGKNLKPPERQPVTRLK